MKLNDDNQEAVNNLMKDEEAIRQILNNLSQVAPKAAVRILHQSRSSLNPNGLINPDFVAHNIKPYTHLHEVDDGVIPSVTYVDNDCKINTIYIRLNEDGKLKVDNKVWKNCLSNNKISFAGGICGFQTTDAYYTIITCGNQILIRNEKTSQEDKFTISHYAVSAPIVKVKSNNEIIVVFQNQEGSLVSYLLDLKSEAKKYDAKNAYVIQSDIASADTQSIKLFEHNGIILSGTDAEVKISKILETGALAPLYKLNILDSESKKLYAYGHERNNECFFWIQSKDKIHLKKIHNDIMQDVASYDLRDIRVSINKKIAENNKEANGGIQSLQLDKIKFIDENHLVLYDKNNVFLLTNRDKKLYYMPVGGQSSKNIFIADINFNKNLMSVSYSDGHTQIIDLNQILKQMNLPIDQRKINEINVLFHENINGLDLSLFPIIVLYYNQYLAVIHLDSMTLSSSQIDITVNPNDFVSSLI